MAVERGPVHAVLDICGHSVVCVSGYREVAGKINLHAVAFADRHGRQNIQEFVEDALRGLPQTLANA